MSEFTTAAPKSSFEIAFLLPCSVNVIKPGSRRVSDVVCLAFDAIVTTKIGWRAGPGILLIFVHRLNFSRR